MFFGQDIIEVATFRAASAPSQGEEPDDDPDILPEVGASEDIGNELPLPPEPDEADDVDETDRVLDEQGRILRDNTYGTIDEDVWRRDFTCNALYYNIDDFSLWDYTGSMEDIMQRRLRLIGDAEQRYREDPVRMLRAARFEAKLGFTHRRRNRIADRRSCKTSAVAGACRAALRRDAQAVSHRSRREVARRAAAARAVRRAVSDRRALPAEDIRAASSSNC